jgi:hypothetical protein
MNIIYKITVDEENAGIDWWDAARSSEDIPESLQSLIEGTNVDTAIVDGVEIDAIHHWMEALPGWDDGPKYAPHPVIIDDGVQCVVCGEFVSLGDETHVGWSTPASGLKQGYHCQSCLHERAEVEPDCF